MTPDAVADVPGGEKGELTDSDRAPSPGRRRYHHGDLRNALIAEAVKAARDNGPDAVVLRDIARRVGVSHNAGYRHFASRDDLLLAVAEVGLAELAAEMRQALQDAPKKRSPQLKARARLRAIGNAYVGFATDQPGMFRTIWASAAYSEEPENVASVTAASDPYIILNEVLDELVVAGAIPAARRPHSEIAAWAGVHGLSTLIIDGPLGAFPSADIKSASERVLDVIDAGL